MTRKATKTEELKSTIESAFERRAELTPAEIEGSTRTAVELAIEASGNPGLSRHNPLQRHYRDVLCSRIHSPQTDTILIAAGRAALGN